MTAKRPKIPTTVRIGVHVWRIIRRKAEDMVNKDGVAEDSWGLCDYEKQEISIQKPLLYSRVQETVLHEIKHACLENLTLSEKDLATAADAEEAVVSEESPIFLQVIQDNPDLMAFLAYKGDKK